MTNEPLILMLLTISNRLGVDTASDDFWRQLALAMLPSQPEFKAPGRPRLKNGSAIDEAIVCSANFMADKNRRLGTSKKDCPDTIEKALPAVVRLAEHMGLLSQGGDPQTNIKRIKRLHQRMVDDGRDLMVDWFERKWAELCAKNPDNNSLN